MLCKRHNKQHDFGLKTNHEFSTHSDLKVINWVHSIVGMYLSSRTSVWLAKVSHSISTKRTIISERLYYDFVLFLHDSFRHPAHQCFVSCFLDSLWIWHMVNKCDWQGLLCFQKNNFFPFVFIAKRKCGLFAQRRSIRYLLFVSHSLWHKFKTKQQWWTRWNRACLNGIFERLGKKCCLK